MSWAAFLLIVLLSAFVGITVTAIAGSLDALGQPQEAWERAGFRRSAWVWQAFGLFLLPAGLVYSGLYFIRVRPRLTAAGSALAVERAVLPEAHDVAEAVQYPTVDRIRIRIPLSVLGATGLALVGAWLLAMGFGALSTGWDGAAMWPSFYFAASFVLLLFLQNLAFGVTLTQRDLVMRGLTRRHVAWRDIVAITQESMWGARYVRLWTRSGRGRRLRAPITQFGVGGVRFDEDFAVLLQWWRTHNPANL